MKCILFSIYFVSCWYTLLGIESRMFALVSEETTRMGFENVVISNEKSLNDIMETLLKSRYDRIFIFKVQNLASNDLFFMNNEKVNFLYLMRSHIYEFPVTDYDVDFTKLEHYFEEKYSENTQHIDLDDMNSHSIDEVLKKDSFLTVINLKAIPLKSDSRHNKLNVYKENDQVIRNMYQMTKKKRNLYLIVPATSMSTDADDFLTELADPVSSINVSTLNGIVNEGLLTKNSDCALFFVSKMILGFSGAGASCQLDSSSVDTTKSVCNKSLVLQFSDIAGCKATNIVVTLDMEKSETSWNCKTVQVSFKFNGKNVEKKSDCSSIYAPYDLSYTCYYSKFSFVDTNNNYSLTLMYYQLQNSLVQNDKFNAAYDCTGFFTVGSISGIIVTVIISLIIAWGLSILFSVQSQVSFEDKANTIKLGAE